MDTIGPREALLALPGFSTFATPDAEAQAMAADAAERARAAQGSKVGTLDEILKGSNLLLLGGAGALLIYLVRGRKQYKEAKGRIKRGY